MLERSLMWMTYSAPISLIALATAISPAWSEKLDYAPGLCATNAGGMVHLAAGGIVLRIPHENLSYILDLPPEKNQGLPVPPDSDEPEGCFGNPIQGASFKIRYGSSPPPANWRELQYPVYGTAGLTLIAVSPDYWGLFPHSEAMLKSACKHNEIDKLEIGLIACYVPMKDKLRPRDDWAVTYRARSNIYGAPFGKDFIVDCDTTFSNKPRQCRVSYKLYERLNITYRFSSGAIPPRTFIDFDRELREWIDAAVVEDYPWRDEAVPLDRYDMERTK